ncbi:hypothetical protein BG261_02715 [Floricoccus tropicus]|uniref:PTS cellobiose transporter subunit IIA n=1 Tax=Floricoccus tropicus TaxID=1859473 RepID=A0A1E8GMP8_9LACT|nr:hypothetical protein [Floricoccus tropicus]OFI49510.1 hypothetical protein BG261_02715 [Floricoccus tropicus]
MNNHEKAALEARKKQTSLQSMYYNRYLIVRYITATLFFANLYWVILLVFSKSLFAIIPAILIIVMIPAMFEQIKLYSTPTNKVPYTKIFYFLQFFVNALIVISTSNNTFNYIYPFMNSTLLARLVIASFALLGIILCIFVEQRLKKISHDEDKHYQRIKQYEKSLQIHS